MQSDSAATNNGWIAILWLVILGAGAVATVVVVPMFGVLAMGTTCAQPTNLILTGVYEGSVTCDGAKPTATLWHVIQSGSSMEMIDVTGEIEYNGLLSSNGNNNGFREVGFYSNANGASAYQGSGSFNAFQACDGVTSLTGQSTLSNGSTKVCTYNLHRTNTVVPVSP